MKPAKYSVETSIRQAQRSAVPLDQLKGNAPEAGEVRWGEEGRCYAAEATRFSASISVSISPPF